MKAPRSPLQLDAFVVNSLRFRANPGYKPGESGGGRVDVEPEVLRHKSEPHKHALRLAVRYRSDAQDLGSAPYDVAIEGTGFFSVTEEVPDDEALELIVYNGSAMLYGLLRGQIAQATAFAPYGPLLLPTVNLVPVLKRYFARRVAAQEPETRSP